MKMLESGLSEADVYQIRRVLSRFPSLKEAILYGSRAKGSYRPGSDIDLVLKGDRLSHQTLLDIQWLLEELPLPYKFDVSLFSHLDNPELIEHIARVGKVFYCLQQPKVS
ncbi:nucleotidyltransferase domain-containing protein [Stutzerimonas chloritidismutans]